MMRSGCNPDVRGTCDQEQLNLTRQSYALAHLFLEQDEASMAGGVLNSLERSGTKAMFATVFNKLSKEFGSKEIQKAMNLYRRDTIGVRIQ